LPDIIYQFTDLLGSIVMVILAFAVRHTYKRLRELEKVVRVRVTGDLVSRQAKIIHDQRIELARLNAKLKREGGTKGKAS
jgi:hypothetical protein